VSSTKIPNSEIEVNSTSVKETTIFRFSYHQGSLEPFPFRRYVSTFDRGQVFFDLEREAKRYVKIVQSFRQPDERLIIAQLTEQLSLNRYADVISIIPCYVDEDINYDALIRHLSVFSNSQGQVILFVNDSAEHDSQESVDSKIASMQSVLAGYLPETDFQVLGTTFDTKKPIGTIRGIITDAVVSKSVALGMCDPIVVSNDIDIDYTPKDYVHRIRRNFDRECLDVLTGPLYYGYSTTGAEFGKEKMLAPELLLSNRLLQARKGIRLDGALDGGRFFATEGPHTAFRLSSYCAAGGYDYSLTLSEDDELGMALFRLRTTDTKRFPTSRNAQFDDRFWLVTNARRQLQAIVSGYAVTDTWVHYPIDELMGQCIDVKTMITRYRQSQQHLQINDISPDLYQYAPEKVLNRIARTVQLSLKNACLSGETGKKFCQLYGINNVDLSSTSNRYRHMTLSSHLIESLIRCRSEPPVVRVESIREQTDFVLAV